jgi:myo-inositol-1(or 4)-monophosphatase
MQLTTSALEADWLGVCRRASAGLRDLLLAEPSTDQRSLETGTIGSGGDRTLVIDARSEEIVMSELGRLAADGLRFVAISEERGEVDFGGAGEGAGAVRVVIDPIDGSLNAKRGVPHHALSIAVASGATLSDVFFGYVYDFGPGEEWWASRGGGAWLDGARLETSAGERRSRDGRLEVLGIESADPRWVAAAIEPLAAFSYRLRALGTIASTLCQVAAARFDAMVTLRGARAVDTAAGQLLVREAGGLIAMPGFADPLSTALDMIPRAPLVAARSERTLDELARIIGSVLDADA